MANFPVNPHTFIPDGMTIEPGPTDRVVCTRLVVDLVPPLRHDNVIIAETNHFVPIQLWEQMRIAIQGTLNEAG